VVGESVSFSFFSPSPPMRDASVFAFRRATPRIVRRIQRPFRVTKINYAELGQ
jgi:hypothetical protein